MRENDGGVVLTVKLVTVLGAVLRRVRYCTYVYVQYVNMIIILSTIKTRT